MVGHRHLLLGMLSGGKELAGIRVQEVQFGWMLTDIIDDLTADSLLQRIISPVRDVGRNPRKYLSTELLRAKPT